MARTDCKDCDGTGFVLAAAGGSVEVARRCACTRSPRTESDLLAAGMPRRYLHCTLDSYRPANSHQRSALAVARNFAECYPAVDRGILFTGNCGLGKTHLAAAILRELLLEQGISGAFADYQDLLKRIQATFSRQGPEAASEDQVLAPVLEAELLVLDDLGARRTTPWAEETVSHLLNVRYNENRTTILTTNLLHIDTDFSNRDLAPGGVVLLSERVSERVLSRLHEMCRVVNLEGEDHRKRPRL